MIRPNIERLGTIERTDYSTNLRWTTIRQLDRCYRPVIDHESLVAGGNNGRICDRVATHLSSGLCLDAICQNELLEAASPRKTILGLLLDTGSDYGDYTRFRRNANPAKNRAPLQIPAQNRFKLTALFLEVAMISLVGPAMLYALLDARPASCERPLGSQASQAPGSDLLLALI